MSKDKKCFLVEILKTFEYSPAPPYDEEKDEGIETLGLCIIFDNKKENVEKRILEALSKKEGDYKINIKEAEQQEGYEVYLVTGVGFNYNLIQT